MRSYMILSAAIVAAMIIALPAAAVFDTADAAVDDKSSAVYFESKDNVSYDDIVKFIDLEVTESVLRTMLESTADFNFYSDGFSISDIRTSGYYAEYGMSRLISESRYQSDSFSVVRMNIEFELKANQNDSKLFAGSFAGDAAYGFDTHVAVKQGDTMTFKGTLRTDYSEVIVKNAESNEGKYVIEMSRSDKAEWTEFVLDAVYKSSTGVEQEFSFTNSFSGHCLTKTSSDFDADEIKNMALGDETCCCSDIDSSGKGKVTMRYEGKDYSAESQTSFYSTVYDGYGVYEQYSGKATYVITDSVLMTEGQYKLLYEEVELKEIFTNFKGTDQQLFEQIGSVGSVTINDFDKVANRADSVMSDIVGEPKEDTSGQIAIAVIGVLAAIVVVLIVSLVVVKRRKNRW